MSGSALRVTAVLPPSAAVTNAWSADPSGTSGTVRFTNVSYNGQLNGTGAGRTLTCTGQ